MELPSTIAKLLGRLSRRSNSSIVAKLHAYGIGQPLLVHPQIGASLARGYLTGAEDGGEGFDSANAVAHSGTIAVINISGLLVHRPMPDICGSGPLSYPVIREVFDAALDDGNVSAIVFRMDSPGGMVSGCFDLVDYIYAQRGRKPIHAQVDDSCYSGCYAIASACDSIQTTRSGGVGSIGVYTFHVDQSGADAKEGVKVTYVASGKHKVEGNPHEPLSEETLAAWTAEVDEIRAWFCETVARNRGISVAEVLATEADTYMGRGGVAAKLADTVGTLEDLLARLSVVAEPEVPAIEQPTAPADPAADEEISAMTEPTKPGDSSATVQTPEQIAAAAATAAAEASAATRGRITDTIRKAKLSGDIRIALLDQVDTLKEDNVAATIENAIAIQDACAAANLSESAAGYVARGVDIATVRKQITEAAASPPGQEVTTRGGGTGSGGQAAWGKAVAAEKARFEKNNARK